MFNPNIHEVLDVLHQKTPLAFEEKEHSLEKTFRKIAKVLKGCSIVFFLALCLLAFFVWWLEPSTRYWHGLAGILYVLSCGAAVLWVLADLVPEVISMFFFRDDFHRSRKLEIVHDLRCASELRQFDAATLELTDKWLSIRIERMRRGIGFFLGGSDKVAIAAVLLAGWGIWKNFPNGGLIWEHYAYAMFSAGAGGIAIGGILGNVVIRDLSYQRDLLSIALSLPATEG